MTPNLRHPAVWLVLLAGAVLVILASMRAPSGADPEDSPTPSGPPAPAAPPPPIQLPSTDEIRALSRRVASGRPELAAVAPGALLWSFDRLAEMLGQAEGRFTPGSLEPSPATARQVVEALAELGEPAFPALVAALTGSASRGADDASPAQAAAKALSALPSPRVVELEAYYRNTKTPTLRYRLVEAASGLRPTTPATTAFLALATTDGQSAVRLVAVRGLGAAGPDSRPALPALRRRLDDEMAGVRRAAAVAVIRIAGPDPDAEAVVEAFLRSMDPTDRWRAVRTLVDLQAEAKALWPGLLPLLGDDKPVPLVNPRRTDEADRVSWAVSEAIVDLEARELVPGLREAVAGDDARARVAATLALLGLGAPFDGVPAAVIDALAFPEDSNWLKRWRLERAAGGLEPAHATDRLLDALAGQLRWLYGDVATRALLRLGPRGRERILAVLGAEGTEYERHSILKAFLEEPSRARGFDSALAAVAENDANSWNRKTAARILEARRDEVPGEDER